MKFADKKLSDSYGQNSWIMQTFFLQFVIDPF
jgi:hypothetical protein